MSGKIEIYTKTFCPYCQRAKDLLRIKGVGFTEYDITEDPLRADELRQRVSRETLPGIFVDDRLIGDCLDLFDLDERGELDVLLGLAFNSGG